MWYFELNGAQQGPEETERIQQRLRNGELSSSTLVWRDGMEDWKPLSQVPELQNSQAHPTSGTLSGQPPQHAQGAPGVGVMPSQNGLALTSMILAICGVVLTMLCGIGFILAIPAVILGHISRKQIRESAGLQSGEGMALTGLIIGYITLALMLVMGVLVAVAVIAEGSFSFP